MSNLYDPDCDIVGIDRSPVRNFFDLKPKVEGRVNKEFVSAVNALFGEIPLESSLRKQLSTYLREVKTMVQAPCDDMTELIIYLITFILAPSETVQTGQNNQPQVFIFSDQDWTRPSLFSKLWRHLDGLTSSHWKVVENSSTDLYFHFPGTGERLIGCGPVARRGSPPRVDFSKCAMIIVDIADSQPPSWLAEILRSRPECHLLLNIRSIHPETKRMWLEFMHRGGHELHFHPCVVLAEIHRSLERFRCPFQFVGIRFDPAKFIEFVTKKYPSLELEEITLEGDSIPRESYCGDFVPSRKPQWNGGRYRDPERYFGVRSCDSDEYRHRCLNSIKSRERRSETDMEQELTHFFKNLSFHSQRPKLLLFSQGYDECEESAAKETASLDLFLKTQFPGKGRE